MLKVGNMEIEIRKDNYVGLWNIWYKGIGGKWAGPYKSKKEAVEVIKKHNEE